MGTTLLPEQRHYSIALDQSTVEPPFNLLLEAAKVPNDRGYFLQHCSQSVHDGTQQSFRVTHDCAREASKNEAASSEEPSSSVRES